MFPWVSTVLHICTCPHNQDREHFCHSKRFLFFLLVSSSIPSSRQPLIHYYILDLSFLEFHMKKILYTICNLVLLFSIISVRFIHTAGISIIHSFYWWIIFHYILMLPSMVCSYLKDSRSLLPTILLANTIAATSVPEATAFWENILMYHLVLHCTVWTVFQNKRMISFVFNPNSATIIYLLTMCSDQSTLLKKGHSHAR